MSKVNYQNWFFWGRRFQKPAKSVNFIIKKQNKTIFVEPEQAIKIGLIWAAHFKFQTPFCIVSHLSPKIKISDLRESKINS